MRKKEQQEPKKIIQKSPTDPQYNHAPPQKTDPYQQLQRTAGNAAVQRMVVQRASTAPAELDDETAQAIQRKKGGGQPVDSNLADRTEAVTGSELNDVRVHTDAEADQLSRKLNARAFTTGRDIFFREGAYAPHTTEGDRLIAHELTHVVQQQSQGQTAVSPKRINDPNNTAEKEADRSAEKITQPGTIQRAETVEEDEEIQRTEEEEEEIQRTEALDEEENMA